MPDIQSGRRFDERALVNLVNPDFPSPALVEMLGKLGFDAVFLDCEHGFASLERIQEMARTARASGMVALVRPELSHPAILTRYLEAGADGLILPHVEATSEVRAAVDVVRRAFPTTTSADMSPSSSSRRSGSGTSTGSWRSRV